MTQKSAGTYFRCGLLKKITDKRLILHKSEFMMKKMS